MLTLDMVAGCDRIVAIDAETTGHPMKTEAEIARMPKGLRVPGVVIQIGCAELLREGDGWTLGRTWESLVNPDGPVRLSSKRIHGIDPRALTKSPRFRDVRGKFEDFIGASPLLAHAAENEMAYLNYEMHRAGLAAWNDEPYRQDRFLDTQVMASETLRNPRCSLDALCDRLWIDRSDRFRFHGALLDACLTAEAFIKISGGFATDEVRAMSF